MITLLSLQNVSITELMRAVNFAPPRRRWTKAETQPKS